MNANLAMYLAMLCREQRLKLLVSFINFLDVGRRWKKLIVLAEKDLRRPKIKEGLKDQTIVKKNTVTLKAVIVGDPVPDVTW